MPRPCAPPTSKPSRKRAASICSCSASGGFNEPEDTFPKATHCVDLTESTIQANSRLFDRVEDVPRQAYTMGIGTIMAARSVLVVVEGSHKAEIVKKAFFGPVTPEVPASILQFHPDATVIVDPAAGALCK